uniref:hypothetical protein n=1 Tax=Exserohilum turcicum TaxID=93612 RepID=UPI0020013961
NLCYNNLTFIPVEYPWDIINYCTELSAGMVSCSTLKKKIFSLKLNNFKSKDEFCEWFRGFTDGEGYFSIKTSSRKMKKASGELIEYRSATFSFILHLAVKDTNVLYNIQNLLGDIGSVKTYENDAFLVISSREDTDKLLDRMSSSFFKLNTTKVLDFFAWLEARSIYYNFLDNRDNNIFLYESPVYASIFDKVVGIKNSINKSRVDFTLPLDHKVIITNEWLLGFIEGEGCFYVNGVSVAFKLAQTEVNRYVLEGIKNYLQLKYDDKMVITLTDCKPNRLKAKPHTELFIGKSNKTAHNFISFLLDLPWLSIKVLDFINWSIIYVLVYEGKHITPQGKETVAKLISKPGVSLGSSKEQALQKINPTDLLIDKRVRELLDSESNYFESDQPGIWNVKSNYKGLPITMHKQDSYVLAIHPENTDSLKFKSNAECAKHFEVTKVSVARWINRNTPISTKKGVFLFKKVCDGRVDT